GPALASAVRLRLGLPAGPQFDGVARTLTGTSYKKFPSPNSRTVSIKNGYFHFTDCIIHYSFFLFFLIIPSPPFEVYWEKVQRRGRLCCQIRNIGENRTSRSPAKGA